MSRRRGLSLVEVLLALGIIAILFGILLPFLVRQRDHGGAARSKSSNNLKMIILACHNYNDAYQGTFPTLVDVGENAPTGAGLRSLFFNIAPYIEADNVYRIFNKANPSSYSRQFDGAAQTIISTYVSPMDQTAPNGHVTSLTVRLPMAPPAPFSQSFTGWYATTSYAANGLIPWHDAGLPRTFKDGTSNTILFGERPQVCTDTNGATTYNLWGYGIYGPSTPAFALLTPDEPAGLPSTGQMAPVLPLPDQWTSNAIPVRFGGVGAQPQQPTPRPFQTGLTRQSACDPRIAGSPHAGGMLVALGDGSVRSLNPNMSDWTFWAACTPDGNETLYSDW
jgi:prepilin-type N-terminal cleavage/methylation domain-containing protein